MEIYVDMHRTKQAVRVEGEKRDRRHARQADKPQFMSGGGAGRTPTLTCTYGLKVAKVVSEGGALASSVCFSVFFFNSYVPRQKRVTRLKGSRPPASVSAERTCQRNKDL